MIDSIETEADYDTALKRIEHLMDAERGTPEGEELDALVALVEAYEAVYHPIGVPDESTLLEGMSPYTAHADERPRLSERDSERFLDVLERPARSVPESIHTAKNRRSPRVLSDKDKAAHHNHDDND
ncbi:MAG: DNA-binding protein [Gammaproteobacteria bacterium]|nr:DNA-binding protein [Gammaproteobacteria bacterium]MCW8840422.1 DNA-binding protein [Gammaproteobacteria bacterium]MCW8957484.1 DNA-binding protein [Gammaproteobacteria bacterium]MCW8991810.1 DNA-binding protein [Gammaproteobacteria bacterium]